MQAHAPHMVLVDDAGKIEQVCCEVQLLPDGRGYVEGVCEEHLPWALNFLRTKCWIERKPMPATVLAVAEVEADLGWSEVEIDALALPLARVTRRRSVAPAEREQVRGLIGEMRARRSKRRHLRT